MLSVWWWMGPTITNCDWSVTTFKEGKTMNTSYITTISPEDYADRFREWNSQPSEIEETQQQTTPEDES